MREPTYKNFLEVPSRSNSVKPLRVLHVLRAPTGGLFRHVLDLSRRQADAGCEVCVITGDYSSGPRSSEIFTLQDTEHPILHWMVPMKRHPHWSDLAAIARVRHLISVIEPDIVHSHGAKGGLIGRVAASLSAPRPQRVYTPHGGSLHYSDSIVGKALLSVEFLLAYLTDTFLFESDYAARKAASFSRCANGNHHRFVNGITAAEFEPVYPDLEASDFLFLGEFRDIKGCHVLIDAMRVLRSKGLNYTLTMVGAGPSKRSMQEAIERCGMSSHIRLQSPMPAREAFKLGRTLVIPSIQESLPYVAIEAGGARVPMIATNVGGIPEIFGPLADSLVSADDANALAFAMQKLQNASKEAIDSMTGQIALRVANLFTLDRMFAQVMEAYGKSNSKTAKNAELKKATEDHLSETKEQIKTLENVSKSIGKRPSGEKCDAIEGLIKKTEGLMEEAEGTALDPGLLTACHDEAHTLLSEILDQEKATNSKLTNLAVTAINKPSGNRKAA